MMNASSEEMKAPITLGNFEELPEEDGYKLELVRGFVVREPRPMPLHGRIAARLTRFLDEHVDASECGVVLVEVDFLLTEQPPTVRAPDIAFVSTGRLPREPYAPAYWRFAPDLAVEILSPANRAAEMQHKVLEYLDAGSRLVWVIDPERRTAVSHGSRTDARPLGLDEALSGGEVLPGFHLPLAQLFDL